MSGDELTTHCCRPTYPPSLTILTYCPSCFHLQLGADNGWIGTLYPTKQTANFALGLAYANLQAGPAYYYCESGEPY